MTDDPEDAPGPGASPGGDGDRPATDPGGVTTREDGPVVTAGDPPAVALVDPQTPGNVGTVARSMKNFGFRELLLVDPPALDPEGEAYGFAGHAREDVLPGAREVTFDHLVENYHTVGTTAITGEDARRHVRFPFATPADLRSELARVAAPTVLVFGREGRGLSNEELERLDRVCSIPASPDYPVLNLGQAATVLLYELRELALAGGTADREVGDPTGEGDGNRRQGERPPTAGPDHLPEVERERAPEPAIERLYDRVDDLLAAIDHPEEKRPKAGRLVRRLVGRAHPTDREVVTLTGVIRRAAELAERGRSED
jgi:TrmH family RNA methyltransferase